METNRRHLGLFRRLSFQRPEWNDANRNPYRWLPVVLGPPFICLARNTVNTRRAIRRRPSNNYRVAWRFAGDSRDGSLANANEFANFRSVQRNTALAMASNARIEYSILEAESTEEYKTIFKRPFNQWQIRSRPKGNFLSIGNQRFR